MNPQDMYLAEAGPASTHSARSHTSQNLGENVLERARGDLLVAINSGAVQQRRRTGPRYSTISSKSRPSDADSISSSTSSRLSSGSSSSYAGSIVSHTSSRFSRASSLFSVSSWRSKRDIASEPPTGPVTSKINNPSPLRYYWCTTCDEVLADKESLKRHDDERHYSPKKLMCPTPGCCRVFWDIDAFRQHHQLFHRGGSRSHSDAQLEYMGQRKHWACGFCLVVHDSRHANFEHVTEHLARGCTIDEWSHTFVIRGLLLQPLVCDAWNELLKPWRSSRYNIRWNRDITSRSEVFAHYNRPGQLQDFLEHFCGSAADARVLANLAFDLALPMPIRKRDVEIVKSLSVNELYLGYLTRPLPPIPSKRPDDPKTRGALVSSNDTREPSIEPASHAENLGVGFDKEALVPSNPCSKALGLAQHKKNTGLFVRHANIREETTDTTQKSKAEGKGSGRMSNSPHDPRVELQLSCTHDFEPTPSPSQHPSQTDSEVESGSQTEEESCGFLSSDSDQIAETSRERLVEQVLDQAFEAMIDRVMEEFWVIWYQEWDAPVRQHGHNSVPPSGRADREGSLNGSTSSATGLSKAAKGKRQRSGDGSGNEDNSDEPGQPPKGPASRFVPPRSQKFACPFRKYDPITYSLSARRVCAASGWDSTARLK